METPFARLAGGYFQTAAPEMQIEML